LSDQTAALNQRAKSCRVALLLYLPTNVINGEKAMTTNEIITLEVELIVEEAEEVIAPGPMLQHNETIEIDLSV
jgi:hypothetical protein